MKNIVFLVIDSLKFDFLYSDLYGSQLTPFLKSVRNNTISFTNVYSQGPYTEAGTKSLFCGCDDLDSYGYLLRFDKSESFITNVFKQSGYKTISIYYPTCLISDWIIKDTDCIVYTSDFMFDVMWDQKFIYYVYLQEKGEFDSQDESDCIRLLEMCFFTWLNFYNDLINGNENTLLIKDLIDLAKVKEQLPLVESEKKRFEANKKEYLYDFLKKGKEAQINKIKTPLKTGFCNVELIKDVWQEESEIIDLLATTHKKCNKKNNKVDKYFLKRVISRIKRKDFNRYLVGEPINLWHHIKKYKEFNNLYPSTTRYANMISARRHCEYIADLIINEKEPVFILDHFEEPHNYCTFFSFDSNDKEVLKSELEYAKDYVDGLNKKDYKGLLAYDLSVRYVDKQFELMFDKLKKANKLKDTIFVICADHGSSYSMVPPRNRNVINFHSENYHIPFIIIDDDIKQGVDNNNLMSNKAIISTILDYINCENKFSIYKKSALKESEDNITIEFAGSGCPDLRRKPVWIQCRNAEYIVNFMQPLKEEFNLKNIVSIYDLKHDPLELNSVSKLRNDSINGLIEALKKRFNELKKQYCK